LGLRKLENCIPSLVIFLSIVQHYALCLHETALLRIPTMGIVDTDGSFNNVVYPIIGNDDSFYSCFLYLELFINAVRLGMRSAIRDEFIALNQNKAKHNHKYKYKTIRLDKSKFFVRGLLWNLVRKFKLKVVNKYHQITKQQMTFYFAENKFGNGRLKDVKLLKVFNSFFSNRQVGLRFSVK